MLCNWQLHKDYQENLKLKLFFYQKTQRSRLVSLDKSISKIYLLNLDNLLPIVKSLYPNFGRPAKNQQGIIRSLILMLDLQEYSITNWASIVKSDKLLFDICGFETQNAPSVASYYDLLSRLWLSSHSEHIRKKSRTRKFHPKPSKKLKANQKLPNKRSGIVKRLVNKLINAKLPKSRPEEILQKFLARCVVDYSGKLGLLGNPSDISVAFDGSPYYSSASHYGVKVCDCKSKGIHNCKCPRRYSDPDATWGWDSYRERWFFGNTLFNVTASDSPNDLPIYLKIVQASRHDSVTTIFALRDIFELYPNLKFKNFLADGAMDNYPTYELLKHYDMLPFISLDSRTKAKFNYQHPSILCFDDKGRPICHGGIPYYNWGYSKPKGIKYRCWFTCHGQEPPEECKCSNSKYGKVVHIKPDYDLRMFPPVPRYSQTFKDKFKTRTSVERSNKRMFVDYHIENVRSQSSKLRFSMATFAVINIHSDAWIKHLKFSLLTTLEQAA
jgi:hypothetical protein